MPLGTNAAIRAGGSPVPARRRRSADDRHGLRGKTVPLSYQEPVSGDAQSSVMVEPTPVAAFKVSEPEFLFQLLIIAFDNPPVFGHLDQSFNWSIQGQRGYPVLSRLRFIPRPFDQEPFLPVRLGFLVIAMCGTDTNGAKTGL